MTVVNVKFYVDYRLSSKCDENYIVVMRRQEIAHSVLSVISKGFMLITEWVLNVLC